MRVKIGEVCGGPTHSAPGPGRRAGEVLAFPTLQLGLGDLGQAGGQGTHRRVCTVGAESERVTLEGADSECEQLPAVREGAVFIKPFGRATAELSMTKDSV